MATLAEFEASFEKVGVETTRIGVGITEILRRLREGGLSTADEQVQFDRLEAHANRLSGISVNPDEPVPDPVPESEVPVDAAARSTRRPRG